jgi:multiple sugar transport system ATP-binding protein
MAIADRIAVLIDGHLEQVAPPEDIYARPASVAVARLFGDPSINLAEVTPLSEHGALSATISGARVHLGPAGAESPTGPCWLGIRPEDLMISLSAADDAVPARILAVTPIHEKAVLLLRLTDGTEWLAALPRDAAYAASDETVFVRFAVEATLLFDRASGRRIELSHRRQAA